ETCRSGSRPPVRPHAKPDPSGRARQGLPNLNLPANLALGLRRGIVGRPAIGGARDAPVSDRALVLLSGTRRRAGGPGIETLRPEEGGTVANFSQTVTAPVFLLGRPGQGEAVTGWMAAVSGGKPQTCPTIFRNSGTKPASVWSRPGNLAQRP